MISPYIYFLVGLIMGIGLCVVIPGLPGAIKNLIIQIRKYKTQMEEQKNVQEKLNKKKDVQKEWKAQGLETYS